MVLFQHPLNAANPRRTVHHAFVNLAMAAFAAIIFMATFRSRGCAQEQNGNKTFGQRLVDEVASKHRPQLIYLGLHGVTPYSEKSEIFASTDPGKLGKKSSCADLHVVDKGIPVMEMKGKSTTVLERLLDSSGHTVGLIVVGFAFTEGQESQAAKLGKEIGEELAQQIPSKSKLFEAGE
jgi:hypothetical protein